METGPKATFGYDVALTEIVDAESHFFVAHIGTERGAEILGTLSYQQASPTDIQRAEQIVANTAQQMGRHMDVSPAKIKDLLSRNMEHPRWDEVANAA